MRVRGQGLELVGVGGIAVDMALAQAHDSDLKRGMKRHLAPLPDDELGRPSPDIDDHARAGAGLAALAHRPVEGQPGLLVARKDAGSQTEAPAHLLAEAPAV